MPRAKRLEYAGAHYHVFDHGVRKAAVFRDDDDRRLFLALLAGECHERSWRCLAYCLMGNHYHLVLRTDKPGLSDGMQSINARYAEYFNREHGLCGHLFQGRFQAKPILHDAYLLEVLRYVVLNPVAAQLCTCVDEWPWSSYAAMLGTRTHREWFDRRAALALFAADDELALSSYVRFVAAGEPRMALESEADFERQSRDAAIRAAHATGYQTLRSLADAFGVSRRTVKRALEG